jgi:hypothetical protein
MSLQKLRSTLLAVVAPAVGLAGCGSSQASDSVLKSKQAIRYQNAKASQQPMISASSPSS